MKHLARKIGIFYFFLTGVLAHLLGAFVLIKYHGVIFKYENKIKDLIAQEVNPQKKYVNVSDEINSNFPAWKPLESKKRILPNRIVVNGQEYNSIELASQAIKDNDTLFIGEGIYNTPLIIQKNNVTLEGTGHVVFDGAIAKQKGAIIVNGNNTTIRNIECKNIAVPDHNGACVRQQGHNLTVEHVFFHSSEQGILANSNVGKVKVIDSRFENLGKNGQSHGIYVQTGSELLIDASLFLASKDGGHEIKSRAEKTTIRNSIIANLSSNDSRLIDLPHGGEFIIEKSVLAQGPGSHNQDVIGYGLEGKHHKVNHIALRSNIILLERPAGNILIHSKIKNLKIDARSNLIIGSHRDKELPGLNVRVANRAEAGYRDYPYLPPIPTK